MNNLKDNEEPKEKILNNSALIAFIFAFIIVELYFISPMYFLFKYNRKYIQRKHIPIVQMFLNLLNCLTYVMISLTGTGDFQNLITNSIGTILCLLVIIQLYISLSHNRSSKNLLLHFFLVFNIIFQIYYFLYKYIPESYRFLTILINITMYLSLNIGTYYAFKEKKPDRVPILSTVLGLLSSIGWSVYAACLGESMDTITLYSNIFSFLVLIFPIVCYIYLVKCQKQITNDTNLISDKNINNDRDTDKNVGTQLSEKENNDEKEV